MLNPILSKVSMLLVVEAKPIPCSWDAMCGQGIMPTEYLIGDAAAAKSLQSCPTLCDPTDGSLPGSSIPGIFQARMLEWVAISFSNAWK